MVEKFKLAHMKPTAEINSMDRKLNARKTRYVEQPAGICDY